MITEKQRRRALARAKWERQQARRTAAERRARVLRIIGGAALTVVVIALVGWGSVQIFTNDSNTPGQTPTDFPSFLTPSDTRVVTSFVPPTSPTATPTPTTGGVTTRSATSTTASTASTGTSTS